MKLASIPLLLLAIGGCDENEPPPPERPARSATAPLPTLAVDAGVGEPIDPPAPPGDLRADLDRFVDMDSCVAERAKLDPLLGDALGAIGYETFVRDACRLLDAAKSRKREACDRIDSSALRARCQSWVAMVTQNADACPLQFESIVTRGRNVTCLAAASRDVRLCTGESRAAQRDTCEALVSRDPARCSSLLPAQRPACQREVTRWSSVLSPPFDTLGKLPAVRAKVIVHGANGTPDPGAPEVDLTADFARGAVVVSAHDRLRVELGTVVESESARIGAPPQKKARLGLAMIFEPQGQKKEMRPTLQKLELELPGEPPIVSPPVRCDCNVTTARIEAKRGAEVAVALEGTLGSAGRSYKVSIEIVTFVRDVVPELPEHRVVPPVHPALRAFGRDGG